MPFAGYKNFDACVAANTGKKNPKAYCATIMRAVENKEIKVNNRMSCYGRTYEDGTMEINTKMGDVVNTVIHEKLHLEHWDMPEEKVDKKADKIESKMSLKDMGNLLLETDAKIQIQERKSFAYPSKITHVSKILEQKIS